MKQLIGFVGQSGVGKDTAGGFLVKNHHFVALAFADALKRSVRDIFNFTDEQVWGSERNAVDHRYTRDDGQPLVPRYALQHVGTEGYRHLHPGIWAEVALRVAKKLLDNNNVYSAAHGPLNGLTVQTPYNGAVITDVRFKNELKAIRDAGGSLVLLRRASAIVSSHASEQELVDVPLSYYDYVIDNRELSLGELEAEVSKMYYQLRGSNS